MMKEGKFDSIQRLIPFATVVAILSFLLFINLYIGKKPVKETETFRTELGEGLGSMWLYALAIIYGRSLLKIALNEGPLRQRFIPDYVHNLSVSVSRKALNLLNRTHKYIGAMAVALLSGHALLMETARWNVFLVIVFILLVWQATFGLILVVRFPPASLKHYGYLVYAQLFSGVMIGIFAAFGHLLV